jgi:predicted dehydrogenase
MPARLRIALVGVSHWHAPRYAEALRARGALLCGASDTDHAAGATAAARLGVEFIAPTEAMIERLRPDFAVVLPRHDQAADEIARVAALRIPMLVEKPMGRHAQETERAAAAIEAAGIFASVCLPNRYMAIWAEVHSLTEEGTLGELRHAHFRTINGPASRYRDSGVGWMLESTASGGGALRNLGVHGADAVLGLAADQPLRVLSAHCSRFDARLGIEEFAAASLASANGFHASLEAGYSYANLQEGGDYEWRIATSGAYLRESNGRLWVHRRGGSLETREVDTPHRLYQTMTHAAMDAFEADIAPPVPVGACVAAVRLQDRIYTAAGG